MTDQCFVSFLIGLFLGVKFFIIEYLYARFPRFKQRHDSVARIWKDLPTDRYLEEQYHRSAINRVSSLQNTEHCSSLWVPLTLLLPLVPLQNLTSRSENRALVSSASASDEQLFHQLFNLPPSETPKPGRLWLIWLPGFFFHWPVMPLCRLGAWSEMHFDRQGQIMDEYPPIRPTLPHSEVIMFLPYSYASKPDSNYTQTLSPASCVLRNFPNLRNHY